jgi:hypothetical protein
MNKKVSSHPLLIEKGRYFRPKIKRENRLCSQCNQIEDEQHFLIHCTKFANVRKLLFKSKKKKYSLNFIF